MDDDTLPSLPAAGRAPEVPGYDVGRLLGRGGTAAVWLATDHVTRRDVALKCFAGAGPTAPDDAEEAVRREVRILSVLEHEHLVKARAVVRLRDGSGDAAGLGLVLDYAPGGSLAALLAARGSLTPGEAVTILTPIAQALAYLHGNGFTHGDVSPGNVLFTARGKPLLSDLGVARMLADPGAPSRPGTDGFRDPAPVDAVRAGLQPEGDVYSVAALGWFCLTGRAPEPETQRPPLPLLVPGVPAGLAEALEAGLRSDRRQRPSAAELAAAVFRSAPAAPVDLSASVHPTVLPQLLTRRSMPVSARARRTARLRAWLRAWQGRSRGGRGRGRRPTADSRLRPALAVSTQRAGTDAASGGADRARHAGSLGRVQRLRRAGVRRAGVRRTAAAFVLAALVTAGGIVGAPLLAGPAPGPSVDPAPASGQGAQASPDAAGAPRDVPAEFQELLAAPRPEDAVRGLAGLRSYALATGSLGLLESVNVPASPAAAADAALGARLAESGHLLEGFEARLSLVESQPESTPARAVVALSVASPPYRELDAGGSVVAEAAAAGERRLRLVLVPVDGRWRIQEILPGAGD
ncbi:serine/threonine protein kinase [Arthrobacter sp. UKPF54-2]|uniref:serine/threonine-protein kinase n=1 Tax=Arthrobacter sp. UKPF54-2 TaxID=2600159 RepID=UPI0011B103F0|nr:serine/threonine-protein kinase [Arthrobacter sp. UKPF54-2]QDY91379.1 serine/threonine protein kinase [Arthrobacter sp. UKPF54-2]